MLAPGTLVGVAAAAVAALRNLPPCLPTTIPTTPPVQNPTLSRYGIAVSDEIMKVTERSDQQGEIPAPEEDLIAD